MAAAPFSKKNTWSGCLEQNQLRFDDICHFLCFMACYNGPLVERARVGYSMYDSEANQLRNDDICIFLCVILILHGLLWLLRHSVTGPRGLDAWSKTIIETGETLYQQEVCLSTPH